MENEFLTTKEAMQLLKCGRTTLWRIAKEGKIKQYNLTQATVRFSKSNILEYIGSCIKANPQQTQTN